MFLAPALDEKEKIEKFLETKQFDYTVLPDAGSLSTDMGIRVYPTHLIINSDGIIKSINIGGSPSINEVLTSKIDELLNK